MLERIKNKNIDESTTGRYISNTKVKKEEEGKEKKKGRGEGLGCGGQGLSKGQVWALGRANA